MKATELMIGDFIRTIYAQKIIKVREIKQSCIYTNDNGYEYNEIEPIPLTAEILEKNGFERVGTSYILKESMFELTNPSHPDRYQDIYYIRLARQNKRVMYVHKLQHFMREFGIEKEIEL